MRTSAELQQQSLIRKWTYFGLIIVLFTAITFSGRIGKAIGNVSETWTVTGQSRTLQMNESEQGEADLAGSTIRLALSGTRGFAITFFWLATIEEQKKHEWNEVDFMVNTITKLQPHFLTPWLFQSWNLSYNVSVESDRVRDKYFYIGRGIDLLAQGERINRARGIDENDREYEVGNPDMRFWIAFYYSNKFGVSDEQHTLRSLLQLSCINPDDRDPLKLRPNRRGKVDSDKFLEFVRQNPMLCRRLRLFVNCVYPDDIVDFLADNSKVPGRYTRKNDRWVLNEPTLQFPVLPQWKEADELVNPTREFPGYFDSFHCALAWHKFAQEPLPAVPYGIAIDRPTVVDPMRNRMPRSPAGIIFRMQPARALSYIAERLQKEGWFDDQGWDIDDGFQSKKWFDEPIDSSTNPGSAKSLIVGNSRPYSSLVAWQEAHRAWEAYGKEHGFLISPQDELNLKRRSEPYRTAYRVPEGLYGPTILEDQVSPEIWASFEAHEQLKNREINSHMTNFRHFLYTSEAEAKEQTVRVRQLFYRAERTRRNQVNYTLAIKLYQEAFDLLIGRPATVRLRAIPVVTPLGAAAFAVGQTEPAVRGLLEDAREFRNDNTIQEELIEKNLAYLQLLEMHHGERERKLLSARLMAGAAVQRASWAELYSGLIYSPQYNSKVRELPSLFVGPIEGFDSQDRPWVSPHNIISIKMKLGLIKAPPGAPEMNPHGGAPPSGGK